MIADKSRANAEQNLATRAKSTLLKSQIAVIRNLSVESDNRGIVLRGQVPLYYHKQLAQELVRNELRDTAILNHIEVVAPD